MRNLRRSELEFIHTPTHEDGGGTLQVKALTRQAKLVVMAHENIVVDSDPEGFLATLDGDNCTFDLGIKSKREEYRVYRRNVVLGDHEPSGRPYIQPYKDDLISRLGSLPGAFDVTPKVGNSGLFHTHYIESMHWDGENISAVLYVSNCEWNGIPADKRAIQDAYKCLVGDVASFDLIPEFIQICNGNYKPNPEYGKGKTTYTPALECKWLFKAMVDAWFEEKASEQQRKVLLDHLQSINDLPYKMDSDFYTTYRRPSGKDTFPMPKGKSMTFDEFKQLGHAG